MLKKAIFKPGDLVKFSNPLNDFEASHVMVVIEFNGDRTKVKDAKEKNLGLTSVFLSSEFTLINL